MKFKVSRTSSGDGKPCDEAIRGTVLYHDERTVATPDDLNNETTKKEWYLNGLNHRVVNNNIVRDFEEDGWIIEIPDLKSLMRFVDKYGEIIVSDNENEIEIYDDYK